MKRIILIALGGLIWLSNAIAQPTLYGVNSLGGNGFGSVYSYDLSSSTLNTISLLGGGSSLRNPSRNLISGNDGKLYGITYYGGAVDKGAFFSYEIATNTLTVLQSFGVGTATGTEPDGTPILSSNGKIYGTTSFGGANDRGTIYEYDPSTNTFTTKIEFTFAMGCRQPLTGLTEASNGKMYGTTYSGGTGSGNLYEYDKSTNTVTNLISFVSSTTGNEPFADLLDAGSGILYGSNSSGGANGNGVLYSYNYTTSTFTKLYDFNSSTGSSPRNKLFLGSNGKLYGATIAGGSNSSGTIFEYNTASSTYASLINLSFSTGANPFGMFTELSSTTFGGVMNFGANSQGVIFSFDYTSNLLTLLYNFNGGNEGGMPKYGVYKSASNKLYGLTSSGGGSNNGVLYEYDLLSSTYTAKKELFEAPNGATPYGGLVQASNGKLYGTTYLGGTNGSGILYEIDLNTNTLSTKKNFQQNNSTGGNPSAALMEASNKKIYGTTESGGNNSRGVLFEYDYLNNTYSSIYHFSSATGSNPISGLIQASNGKLYSVAKGGGANFAGVLYEFDLSTNTYSVKHDFSTATGESPYGTPIEGSNGKLYGTTRSGGTNSYGTLYEFDLNTNTYTVLYHFQQSSSGSTPLGKLVVAGNSLWGTTRDGGTNGEGTLFEYNLTTNTFTVKKNFTASEGSSVRSDLMLSSNGYIYGLAYEGGANSLGYIFQVDPNTNTFTVIKSFSYNEGFSPEYSSLLEACLATKPNVTISGTTLTTLASANNYAWFDCITGTPVTGATSATLSSPTDGNSYALAITDNNQCKAISDCEVYSATANVSAAYNNPKFNLYPNPTHDASTLSFSLEENNIQVVVINANGEEISNTKYTDQNYVTIDLEKQPIGIYYLTIYNQDGYSMIYSGKLIKQ